MLYTTSDDGIQTTRAKADIQDASCLLKGYLEFLVKMTIKHNKVSAELRVAEKAIT
jgi:hypothetical protein